jgi:hypothetical protein
MGVIGKRDQGDHFEERSWVIGKKVMGHFQGRSWGH